MSPSELVFSSCWPARRGDGNHDQKMSSMIDKKI
jgi:hypothetical protein